MTKENLKNVKRDLTKLYELVRSLSNYFDMPKYTMISVLLQNAQFVSISDELEVEDYKLHYIKKLLFEIKEYSPSYFEKWVFDEYSMILDSVDIIEEEEFNPYADS
jgi:hypothetical protein